MVAIQTYPGFHKASDPLDHVVFEEGHYDLEVVGKRKRGSVKSLIIILATVIVISALIGTVGGLLMADLDNEDNAKMETENRQLRWKGLSDDSEFFNDKFAYLGAPPMTRWSQVFERCNALAGRGWKTPRRHKERTYLDQDLDRLFGKQAFQEEAESTQDCISALKPKCENYWTFRL
ncbi:hypothetical protein PENTCL1PPCAC_420 [Pristionchus entomophagus]|uniref:Uncharacterized protein n=1 Tax=Pristionchus entomophagus TaxID=358040 RepID=A0AAV5S759_9BILA|nr:hypothetical protein PENTCL1PPCAC_420 [Pristionchus entomophagus]